MGNAKQLVREIFDEEVEDIKSGWKDVLSCWTLMIAFFIGFFLVGYVFFCWANSLSLIR